MYDVKVRMSETLTQTERAEPTACRAVHPEDLAVGEYVAVLQQRYQLGTYVWCGVDPHQFPPNEPVELTFRGTFEALLEVKEICFPFVLCTDYDSNVVVLDTRSTQLGRLSASFADGYKAAMKAKSNKANDSKSRKKKKKRKK
jgi:hypothetical protein